MKSVLVFVSLILSCWCRPFVEQSTGEPWPLPQVYKPSSIAMEVSSQFSFLAPGKECDILESAITRYFNLIFGEHAHNDELLFEPSSMLKSASLNLMGDCEVLPHFNMDESCGFFSCILLYFT